MTPRTLTSRLTTNSLWQSCGCEAGFQIWMRAVMVRGNTVGRSPELQTWTLPLCTVNCNQVSMVVWGWSAKLAASGPLFLRWSPISCFCCTLPRTTAETGAEPLFQGSTARQLLLKVAFLRWFWQWWLPPRFILTHHRWLGTRPSNDLYFWCASTVGSIFAVPLNTDFLPVLFFWCETSEPP